MTYLEELRKGWRPLLASMIGLSSGFMALAFTNSIMGPHLIRAFGWSKADFALLGIVGMISLVGLPVAGRLVDRFDVRRTASIGFIAGPIGFVVMSRMSGNFYFYLFLVIIQSLLCMTTTSTVFTRAVVEHTQRARGIALAITASGPALTIGILGPMLNNFVTTHGWRNGFIALAIYTGVGGFAAIALVPPRKNVPERKSAKRENAWSAYRQLARMPVFWIMLTGILLTNMSNFIVNSQLGVLMQAYDVQPQQISGMISIFAIGVLCGRFACGLALDRFSTPIVAMLVMAMPAIGQYLIASDTGNMMVLTAAILLVGLSYGAEADLIGYLVARSFGIRVYGTVLGLMAATISLSSTFGALILRTTLKSTGSYSLYLVISGTLALIGSLFFLILPKPDPEVLEDDDSARAQTVSD